MNKLEQMESDAEEDHQPLMFSSGEQKVDNGRFRKRNRRVSVSGGSGKSTTLGRFLSMAILCSYALWVPAVTFPLLHYEVGAAMFKTEVTKSALGLVGHLFDEGYYVASFWVATYAVGIPMVKFCFTLYTALYPRGFGSSWYWFQANLSRWTFVDIFAMFLIISPIIKMQGQATLLSGAFFFVLYAGSQIVLSTVDYICHAQPWHFQNQATVARNAGLPTHEAPIPAWVTKSNFRSIPLGVSVKWCSHPILFSPVWIAFLFLFYKAGTEMFQHTTLNKEKLGFAAMFVGDMQASTSLFGSIQEMWSMAGIWWLAIIIFFMLVAIPLIESFWLIFIGMQYFNDRRIARQNSGRAVPVRHSAVYWLRYACGLDVAVTAAYICVLSMRSAGPVIIDIEAGMYFGTAAVCVLYLLRLLVRVEVKKTEIRQDSEGDRAIRTPPPRQGNAPWDEFNMKGGGMLTPTKHSPKKGKGFSQMV